MGDMSYEQNTYLADLRTYSQLMSSDNSAQISRLKRNLAHALRQDVTPKQRLYMLMYYSEGLNMREISQRTGTSVSTVSRTLKRGRQRLYRCLRYGAATLLEESAP